jgi:hypothetical protein
MPPIQLPPASGLTINRARHKPLATCRTLDPIKIDAPHIGWRNHAATSRADGIERSLHFFEIDFPGAWHAGYISPFVARLKLSDGKIPVSVHHLRPMLSVIRRDDGSHREMRGVARALSRRDYFVFLATVTNSCVKCLLSMNHAARLYASW